MKQLFWCKRFSAALRSSGTIATVMGVITLLFGATAVFVQLQDAFNRVWGVAPKPRAVFTTLFRKRLLSFALLLGIGFLLIVSLVLSAALMRVPREVAGAVAPNPDALAEAERKASFAKRRA